MAGLLGSTAFVCVWAAGRVSQVGRDRLAATVRRLVDHGEAISYCVYLRPFWTTGKLVEADPGTPVLFLNWWVLLRSPHRQLENRIAHAIRSRGPLIALGVPGEAVGAGRLRVEEETWRKTAQRLMASAFVLFCVPSHHEGTRWEVKWLKDNAQLHKTIFLMPPKAPGLQMNDEWAATREVLAQDGLLVPEYDDRGMLFTLANGTGAVVSKHPLASQSSAHLRGAIDRILRTV